MSDDFAQREHDKANLVAKALVEALHGVGSKGRIMTSIGRAMVSDVQSHGPLVVVDGIAEDGQAYRLAKHYSQVDFTVVLTDFEPGEGPEKEVGAEAAGGGAARGGWPSGSSGPTASKSLTRCAACLSWRRATRRTSGSVCSANEACASALPSCSMAA